jgi:hypothetical protein
MGEGYKCPIVITEGEKKAAALISRGYAAIGLPGINSGYRVTERGTGNETRRHTISEGNAWELHSALQPFDTVGREITIIFDYREGIIRRVENLKQQTPQPDCSRVRSSKLGSYPAPAKE